MRDEGRTTYPIDRSQHLDRGGFDTNAIHGQSDSEEPWLNPYVITAMSDRLKLSFNQSEDVCTHRRRQLDPGWVLSLAIEVKSST